jgi:hypothetical protein
MSKSLPPLRPDEIEQMIRSTGIYDPGKTPADYDSRVARASQDAGIFVRGARQGGSPMLNFMSRIAFAVALAVLLLLLVGLGWGGRLVYRGLKGDAPPPPALVAGPGEIVCRPEALGKGAALPYEGLPARILASPQTTRGVLAGGGAPIRLGADRALRVEEGGGMLVVQYVGEGEAIRGVHIAFPSAVAPCRALQAAGVLPGEAKFRLSAEGQVSFLEGQAAPILKDGGLLTLKVQGGPVASASLSAPAPKP